MSKADDIIEKLDSNPDVEESRSEIEQLVEEQTTDFLKNQSSAMDEDEVRKHAASVVANELRNLTGGSGFGGGDTEELPILALGYQNKDADHFVTDQDALLASGIVNPAEDPAGYAVFIIDSSNGVDLDHAAEAFSPLNTVRGFASRRRVGSWDDEPTIKKGGNPVYLINSTDESKFEVVEPSDADDEDPISELPDDREAKREMIHEHFIAEEERVTIDTYAEHESITNNNGYAVAFGADVKRFRGEVVDSYIFDSGDGTMTLTDDSVFGEEDIPEELISDNQRTPGMQVSIGGDLVYGEKSVLDLYGSISQRPDGQYVFDALGVIPIIEMEYDGPDGSGSSNDDDVEEDTI